MAAFSTKSFYSQHTADSSKGIALAADHSSYKHYGPISWSIWVKAGPGNSKHFWSMFETSTGNKRSWIISSRTDGAVRLLLSNDGSASSQHRTPTGVLDFSWKHIVWTFNDGTITCYVNGVAVTVTDIVAWTFGAVDLYAADVQLVINGTNPSAIANDTSPGGNVQNFSLWNKVLTLSEVQEIYNSGTPTNLANHSAVANLTNWYRMDQSSTAPTLTDSIASGANATITSSGTTGVFAQSDSYPRNGTDPGVANVRSSTAYRIEGEDKVGTCAVPDAEDVLDGVSVGATVGTLEVPADEDVRAGVGSGSLEVPDPSDVLEGIDTDDTVGTLVLPAENEVKHDIGFGAEGTEYQGSYRGDDLWEAVNNDDLRLDTVVLQDGEQVTGLMLGHSASPTFREKLAILFNAISVSTLTDEEFESLEIDSLVFDSDTYAALLAVLDARESVSNDRDRLRYYFLARSADLVEAASVAKTEIFIGGAL